MKKFLVCVITALTVLCFAYSAFASSDTITGTYTENTAPVRNPGKGLVYTLWDVDNPAIEEEELKYFSDIYVRWNWNIIEPEEGKFNWEAIDKYIDFCEKNDLKLFFGIMNQDFIHGYSTPKWVFDAGAKSVACYCGFPDDIANKKYITYVPVWNDEIFLAKYNNFVKALADRYANHPRLSGISLIGYGTYGEGVVGSRMAPVNSQDAIPSITDDEVWNLIHRPWLDNFPDKKVIYECDYGHERAIEEGADILKKNALMGGLFDQGNYLATVADDKAMVMHEFFTTYDIMNSNKIRPTWEPDYFMSEITQGRSSYVLFPLMDDWFTENKDLFRLVANRIGYHFVLREAELTESASVGEQMNVRLKFDNVGMSRLFDLCTIRLAVLDKNGVPVWTKNINGADPSRWYEGKSYEIDDTFVLENIGAGSYRLAVGFMKNPTDTHPTYMLGNYNCINGWYVIATGECDGEEFTITRMNTEPHDDILHSSYKEGSTTYVPLQSAFSYNNTDDKISYTISGNVGAVNKNKDISLLAKNSKGFPVYVNQLETDENGGFLFNVDYRGNLLDNDIILNCAGNVYGDEPQISISFNQQEYEVQKLNGKYYIPLELFSAITGIDLELDAGGNAVVETIQTGDAPYEQIASGIADVSLNSDFWSGDAEFTLNDGELIVSNTSDDKTFERYVGIDYDKWYKVSFKSKGKGKVRLRIYDSWNSPITAVCTEPSLVLFGATYTNTNTLYFKIPSYFYEDMRVPYVRFVFETTGQGGSTAISDLAVSDDQLAIFGEMNKNGFALTVNPSVENDAFGYTRRTDGLADYVEDNSYSGAGSIRFDQSGPAWSSLAQLYSDRMRKLGNGSYNIEGRFMAKSKDPSNPEPNLHMWLSIGLRNNGENGVIKEFSVQSVPLKEGKWVSLNKDFDIDIVPAEEDLKYDYQAFTILTVGNEGGRRNQYIYVDDFKITKKHTDDIHIYGLTASCDDNGTYIGVSGSVKNSSENVPAIYAAIYDLNGNMKSVNNVTMSSNEIHNITLPETMEDGDTLKVFFWESKTLKPFENVESFEFHNGKLEHNTTYANDFDVVVLK